MSILTADEVACPLCAEKVRFDVARSVNADRRPDLRDAIIDGSFQRETCPHCGTMFRLDPRITYLDTGRRQWLLAAPCWDMPEWGSVEKQTRDAFERSYGPGGSAMARAIGRELSVRLVFGWAALREKLVCAEAGLDDATLELLKLSMIDTEEGSLLGDETDLRLIEADGATLTIGLLNPVTEALAERITVPRGAYDAIAAEPEIWAALRAEITAGPLVDLNRLLVAPQPD
jgi:hypothetical protein